MCCKFPQAGGKKEQILSQFSTMYNPVYLQEDEINKLIGQISIIDHQNRQ